ncbi:MAG: hypothetical protein KME46_19385 [Brasilonema angustatum HA4187-MV1]|jgi:hypothetical protein|nr:hypothetical protein [Brasilonema angustatum HA4187-MV1]
MLNYEGDRPKGAGTRCHRTFLSSILSGDRHSLNIFARYERLLDDINLLA